MNRLVQGTYPLAYPAGSKVRRLRTLCQIRTFAYGALNGLVIALPFILYWSDII